MQRRGFLLEGGMKRGGEGDCWSGMGFSFEAEGEGDRNVPLNKDLFGVLCGIFHWIRYPCPGMQNLVVNFAGHT